MIRDIIEANNRLIERLDKDIINNEVFHAHIIVSRYGDDRETLAKAFIKALLGHERIEDVSDSTALAHKIDAEIHEDVQVLRREKSNIPVKRVRKSIERVRIAPVGERNIILIIDGDHMDAESQNALLKTLEEPPGDTVIIILIENTENLLDTVKSRCMIHQLEEAEHEDPEEIRRMAEEVMALTEKRSGYYCLLDKTRSIEKSRDDMNAFIYAAEDICGKRMLGRDSRNMPYGYERIGEDIRALEEARRKLDRGLAPRYVLKDLLLKIGG